MDYTQLVLGSLFAFGVFVVLVAAMIKTPVLTFTSALILCLGMLLLPSDPLPVEFRAWAVPGLFLLAAAVLLTQPKFGQTSMIRVMTHVGLHLLVVFMVLWTVATASEARQSMVTESRQESNVVTALLWLAAAILPIHLLRWLSAPTYWGRHLRVSLSLRHAVRLQLPLPEALRAAAENHRDSEAMVLKRVAKDLDRGRGLGDALRKWNPPSAHPWVAPLLGAAQLHRPADGLDDVCRTLRRRAHVPPNRPGFYGILYLVLFVQCMLVAAHLIILPMYDSIFAGLGRLSGPMAWIGHYMDMMRGPLGKGLILLVFLFVLVLGVRRLFPGFVAGLVPLNRLVDLVRWYVPLWRRLERSREQGKLIRHLRAGIRAGYGLDRILDAARQLRLNCFYARAVRSWHRRVTEGADPHQAAVESGVGSSVARLFRHRVGTERLCTIVDAVCEQIESEVAHRRYLAESIAFPVVVILIAIPVALLSLWLVGMMTTITQLAM